MGITPLHSKSIPYLAAESGQEAGIEGRPDGPYWLGSAYKELVPPGTLQTAAITALIEGRDLEGEPLVQLQERSDGRSRQLGWDLCLGAPKSVSALWGIVDPDHRRQLTQKHQAAVRAAFDYIEKEAAFSRAGAGGKELLRAELIGFSFPHTVSAELEPHLHDHIVIPNTALRSDGQWRTLRSSEVYDHYQAIQSVYMNTLALGMRELGLPVRKERHWFEIAGFPEQLKERLSTRRNQIQATRPVNAKEAQVASYATRTKRPLIAFCRLQEKWSSLSDAFGFTKGKALELFHKGNKSVDVFLTDWAIERAFLVSSYRIAENTPEYYKRELVSETFRRLQLKGIPSDRILDRINELLEQGRHSTITHVERGRVRCTTPDVAKRLKATQENLAEYAHKKGIQLEGDVVESPLSRLWDSSTWALSDKEKEGVSQLLSDSRAVRAVSSALESESLDAIRASAQILKGCGASVLAVSATPECARIVEDSLSVESYTTAEFASSQGTFKPSKEASYAVGLPEPSDLQLSNNTTLFVFEAHKLSPREFDSLIAAASRASATLILVGELSPKDGSSSLYIAQALNGTGVKPVDLDRPKANRNAESWARRAQELAQQGNIPGALAQISQNRHLYSETSSKGTEKRFLASWVEAVRSYGGAQGQALIVPTEKHVPRYNQLAQAALLKAGLIGSAHIGDDKRLHLGDRVRLHAPIQHSGYREGDIGRIERIDGRLVNAELVDVVTVRIERPHRIGPKVRPHTRVLFTAEQLLESAALAYASTPDNAWGSLQAERAFILADTQAMQSTTWLKRAISIAPGDTHFYAAAQHLPEGVEDLQLATRNAHERRVQDQAIEQGLLEREQEQQRIDWQDTNHPQ